MSKRRPCPVTSCSNVEAAGLPMCRTCWRKLPAKMRQAVRSMLHAFESLPPASASRTKAVKSYLSACEAAVAAVNEKEAAHAPA
jgi:hypothetical protein